MDKKNCLECSKPIYGRADKKFCGDMCRSSYHNQNGLGLFQPVKTINSILKTNRKIFIGLLKQQEELEISENTLNDLGFNFNYCTKAPKSKNQIQSQFCYEFSYYKTENETYKVLKEPVSQYG